MRLRKKNWTDDFLNQHSFYLINYDNKKIDLKQIFLNNNPTCLEIGCGKGQFITTLALKNLNTNYIGMEKSSTITGVALKKSLKEFEHQLKEMTNLKYFNNFAEDLSQMFSSDSFNKIYLNFSDPWPKARHYKKRLTYVKFLDIYSDILIKNGYLEFKTDNDSLYNFTIEQLNLTNKWEVVLNTTDLYNNTELLKDNIATEYETKFHLANKNIYKIVIKNLK
ncbi:tRNA (guanine-N(7)-)-methyltransferase [synthetic Mycoplasma mycoides JCVI-syn1.0]|uniref:tRNA (guanine-N(7)-)-methyltransferase n=1 Tax=Mycoplasma mycoides subsp. capri TaxID=40477 RepID=A0AB38GDJ9_MYCMC|nr:tRNA (guanosine(46)-N7)-methyltransferase TrmB [Mycoplasma mycoides]ADH21463.1 tRNA (guanine-N(7)-)-methyltransferase [synthetic Mycoplasma mycoides JCVI-syn1.0]ACU78375.1 tRNA (guanine-N(7)-)-methyltransferase [Mycoplasma mycoides subsp. capri str. GM12]ACU79204.1 tRNA (guanine-N(7)-)-methyltransferase [Mycoplasma mycoides subsp. capri str. GM12]QVK05352.1 tRNA (guanosine(46)-N7)-methyltransferase TrmB [Mycoplasma mycoides subsp. capri]SRX58450.1 tRNA (guanosine(46)-N7)-methyltransferase T